MYLTSIRGTSVRYVDYWYTVGVFNSNGQEIELSNEVFDDLYYRLNDNTTALKEHCIQYAMVSDDKSVCLYPDWFVDALWDGHIIYEYGAFTYYDDIDGEIAMSPNSVILRNFKGHLMYMEYERFIKYYETPNRVGGKP